MDSVLIIALVALAIACIAFAMVIADRYSNHYTNKDINSALNKANQDVQIVDSKIKELETEVRMLSSNLVDSERTLKDSFRDQVAELKETIEQSDIAGRHFTKTRFEICKSEFDDKIDILATTLEKVVKENEELRKKLAFYVEIEEDSKNINLDEDPEVEKQNIQRALAELTASLNKEDDQENQEDVVSTTEKPYHLPERKKKDDVAKGPAPVYEYDKGKIFPTLDNEQDEIARAMIQTNDNFFITGKAGTGKSFLINIFVQHAKETKNILKLAPTGIAARNIDGATLHSAFEFRNLENLSLDEITSKKLRFRSNKRVVLELADIIIIDEISMVRADTFDKIDKILRIVCNNDKPFGGKQVIAIGDLFQLPPITNGEGIKEFLHEKYGGVHFFFSEAYKQGEFRFYELSHNHRQEKDAVFFDILNNIREGKISADNYVQLNSRYVPDMAAIKRQTILYPNRADANYVNEMRLADLEGENHIYQATIEYVEGGIKDPNKLIRTHFQIPEVLKLKIGALVMMVSNDPDNRWSNGTIGIVEKLSDNRITVAIKGRHYVVERTIFTSKDAVYVDGKIEYVDSIKVRQFPMTLAYALTIHKSQGMTYKRIACDLSNCFAPGQAYVALSRCATLEGLTMLSPIDKAVIKTDQDVLDFYHSQLKAPEVKVNQ